LNKQNLIFFFGIFYKFSLNEWKKFGLYALRGKLIKICNKINYYAVFLFFDKLFIRFFGGIVFGGKPETKKLP
jgi:hypothetical protein